MARTMRTPGPFLKWAGGKGQLLAEILPRLPGEISGTYIEPFVGGGAVFFELCRVERIARARLCDTNGELVDAYRAVRDHVEDLIAALGAHVNEEAHYYEVRAKDPATMPLPERAARTLYLNRCGFNGLHRVNAAGQFNVPFGRYKNPRICDPEGLRAASKALARAELRVTDFAEACADAGPGDVVYFDPPYLPLSPTSNFTSYAKAGFGEAEHRRLAEVFAGCVARGAYVLLSNSDMPLARELFDGFRIVTVQATRAINSKGDSRGKVNEILVQGLERREAAAG
ncbi:MAG: DNA adenine methylase [Myxococcales bacterium]|nr:DNA adenine methylase [Myxococcales bacterium]